MSPSFLKIFEAAYQQYQASKQQPSLAVAPVAAAPVVAVPESVVTGPVDDSSKPSSSRHVRFRDDTEGRTSVFGRYDSDTDDEDSHADAPSNPSTVAANPSTVVANPSTVAADSPILEDPDDDDDDDDLEDEEQIVNPTQPDQTPAEQASQLAAEVFTTGPDDRILPAPDMDEVTLQKAIDGLDALRNSGELEVKHNGFSASYNREQKSVLNKFCAVLRNWDGFSHLAKIVKFHRDRPNSETVPLVFRIVSGPRDNLKRRLLNDCLKMWVASMRFPVCEKWDPGKLHQPNTIATKLRTFLAVIKNYGIVFTLKDFRGFHSSLHLFCNGLFLEEIARDPEYGSKSLMSCLLILSNPSLSL